LADLATYLAEASARQRHRVVCVAVKLRRNAMKPNQAGSRPMFTANAAAPRPARSIRIAQIELHHGKKSPFVGSAVGFLPF
jgi:hypothetical protein